MRKSLLVFLLVCSLVFSGCTTEKPEQNTAKQEKKSDNINQLLVEVSFLYADSLTKTTSLSDISNLSYEEGNKYLEELANNWLVLRDKTAELEERSSALSFSIDFIDKAYAYDKDEITDIFDKAPPGKKIKTLAQKLNVSADKAYKLLKMSQQQLTAEAWNKAGDTFETLENTAKVIQDGCKVGLMIGGAHIAAEAGVILSALDKAAMIVGGADLLLQIGDDVSNIAVGYNNQASAIFGGIRKVTEPLSTIIGFAGLLNMGEKGIDLLNASTFVIDQSNAMIQDGKVVGIKIRNDKTAEISNLKSADVPGWLKDNSISDQANKDEIMKEIAQMVKDMEQEDEEEEQPEEPSTNDEKTEQKNTPEEITPVKEEPVVEKVLSDEFIGTWYVRNTSTNLKSDVPYIIKANGEADYTIKAGGESMNFPYSWEVKDNQLILSNKDFGTTYYSVVDSNTLDWVKTVLPTGDTMTPGQNGLIGSRLERE